MSIFHLDSPRNRMSITERGGLRTLAFARNQQSSMRLDDPFETDIEYVAYLHLTLAVMPHAHRTLVIGLGGGSLVKRMWRDYPKMSIHAVEVDPEVIEVARAYFELPEDERIRVFARDGRHYLENTDERYDIIVIDAFDDDRIPRPLTTEESMRTCRDRLTSGGVIAYNSIGALNGRHSKTFRSLYRTAANVWPRLWVFDVKTIGGEADQTRNLVLLASETDLSDEELLRRVSDRVGGMVTVPGFDTFGDRLHRSPIRGGDVGLLLD